jgi:hypothetical protein
MKQITRFASILVIALGLAASAHANLTGDTITTSGLYVGPTSATVTPTADFTGIFGYVNFDFAATTLTVTPTTGVSWSGFGPYTFTFNDTITGVSIASNTGFSGGIVNNFSFNSDSLTLDMSSGEANNGSALVFDIASTNGQAVPDSGSTVALLGAAMVCLVAFRRRFAR